MKPLDSGDSLMDARCTLELTQTDLAREIGVSLSTLQRAEKAQAPDLTLSLAVECLLRRRAQRASTAVSPEERAERRFRESERLRELKEARTSPEQRAERRFREAARLRQLKEEAGWRPAAAARATESVASGIRRGRAQRNRERDEQRPLIAARVKMLQGASPEEVRLLITSWQVSTPPSSTYLKAFTDALVEGRNIELMDPLITLPHEEV